MKTLRRSLRLANDRRHEYATIEHLLLALVDDPDARDALVGCGADVEKLAEFLIDFLDHELDALLVEGVGEVDAKPTAGFQRIIQRAAIHVQSSGRSEVKGGDVLAALFSERESHAVYFLQEQAISRLDVINYLRHGIRREGSASAETVSVDVMFDRVIRTAENLITFIADIPGQNANVEDVSDIMEVLRLDASWSWRVSETIWRVAAQKTIPYRAHQTIEQLNRAADLSFEDGKIGRYLNTIEFDPLEETLLQRPLIYFSNARHFNPIEVTIAISAASLTIVIMAAMWSLRTWKKMQSDEEFATAKTELLKRITAQISCRNPKQLKNIETLVLGLLSCPNGVHEKGDEISISVPHLLSARVGKEGTSLPSGKA